MVINFGKYKGHNISDVIDIDPEYCQWAIDNNIKPFCDLSSLEKDSIKYNSQDDEIHWCHYAEHI